MKDPRASPTAERRVARWQRSPWPHMAHRQQHQHFAAARDVISAYRALTGSAKRIF
jgi:hypothetical protein